MKRDKNALSVADVERQVQQCYSTWSGSYYDSYSYTQPASYPPVHRKIIQSLLRKKRVRTLLDAGCGPASLLRDIDRKINRFGFDLTTEMVGEARRILTKQGVPAAQIWKGSVLRASAFSCPAKKISFDAAICIGVFPHIRPADDERVVKNLLKSVKPGGLVVAEARNQLFSLFTINRYSYEFIKNELIGISSASGSDRKRLEKILRGIEKYFRVDFPPIRRGTKSAPGYDEVLSRTHNPLTFLPLFEKAGFANVKPYFYHYHCVPPLFEKRDPKFFRKESLRRENPNDWRGYFQASAFLVVAERPK